MHPTAAASRHPSDRSSPSARSSPLQCQLELKLQPRRALVELLLRPRPLLLFSCCCCRPRVLFLFSPSPARLHCLPLAWLTCRGWLLFAVAVVFALDASGEGKLGGGGGREKNKGTPAHTATAASNRQRPSHSADRTSEQQHISNTGEAVQQAGDARGGRAATKGEQGSARVHSRRNGEANRGAPERSSTIVQV